MGAGKVGDRLMRAPTPHATVRTALADPFAIPPAPPMIQAATAWRRDVRAPARTARRTYAATLAFAIAFLAGWLAVTQPQAEPETIAVVRTVAR
jgi:hypothetical protein